MLQQEQIRDVLQRAEEIQRSAYPHTSQSELEHVLSAAEEAGLSREAVLQAMRERLSSLAEPPPAGERVYVKSADGNYYPCEVVESGEATVKVRFAKGGTHTVAVSDVRPFSLLPGQKITVNWPVWGWWTCEIVSYDAATDKVRVTDGFSQKNFRVDETRMAPVKERHSSALKDRLLTVALAAAAGGGVVGALLTWLLMR